MNRNNRFIKIMAWILSIIMVGSMGTLLVTLLVNMLSH